MPKETNSKIPKKLIFLILSFIMVAWLATPFLVPMYTGYEPDGAGTFGDMFGATNALFSGFAFAGLIVAILLQKEELRLQREELSETREVLKDQKDQFIEQNKTLRKQSFEDTFFQLMRLYNDIISTLDTKATRNNKITITGRDVFINWYDAFQLYAGGQLVRLSKAGKTTVRLEELINDEYLKFYETNKSDLSHYFLTLYHIVKFVHLSDMENKKFYTDILRAQLSSYELLFLHYDSKSKYGAEKFAPLIEEYNLTKHMPVHEKLEVKLKATLTNKGMVATDMADTESE